MDRQVEISGMVTLIPSFVKHYSLPAQIKCPGGNCLLLPFWRIPFEGGVTHLRHPGVNRKLGVGHHDIRRIVPGLLRLAIAAIVG